MSPKQDRRVISALYAMREFDECLNYVYTFEMKATVQKWGNSLGVRIPSIMAKDLMLENGSEVELIEESDKIIIQPKRRRRLNDLLQAINESNIHEEIEFNGPYGSEAW